MPNAQRYQRDRAREYAVKYALEPNQSYPYYQSNDCTNFVSQCLRAGGCMNYFHPTHPWWCIGNETSVCWAVAGSLYWFFMVCTKENSFGIKTITTTISGTHGYIAELADILQIGDIIQYVNDSGRIQHSTIITDFKTVNGRKSPLISQHTGNQVNIPWQKRFKKTIFHHIAAINGQKI